MCALDFVSAKAKRGSICSQPMRNWKKKDQSNCEGKKKVSVTNETNKQKIKGQGEADEKENHFYK